MKKLIIIIILALAVLSAAFWAGISLWPKLIKKASPDMDPRQEQTTFTPPSGRYKIVIENVSERSFIDNFAHTKTTTRSVYAKDDANAWADEEAIFDIIWSPDERHFVMRQTAGASDSTFSIFDIQNGKPVFMGHRSGSTPHPYDKIPDIYVGHYQITDIKWLDNDNVIIKLQAGANRDWGGETGCMAGGPVDAEIEWDYLYTFGKGITIKSRNITVITNQFRHSKIDDIFTESEMGDGWVEYKGKMSKETIGKLRRRITNEQDGELLEELIMLNRRLYE